MKHSDERRSGEGSLLDPTRAGAVRAAVDRLRESGLSRSEAAAEVIRENLYEWLDSESDSDAGDAHARLRIVKR